MSPTVVPCIFIVFLQGIFAATTFQPVPVINGGQEVQIESSPYMASLRELENIKPRHLCGAVIISQKYLLTAAQCFYSKQPDWFGIAVGSNTKNDKSVSDFNIKRIIVHEKYDEFTAPFKHDIALIELNDPLQFNEKVKAIEINGTFFEGHIDAMTVGFGGFYDRVNKLQSIKMTTMTNVECRNRVDRLTKVYDYETLCAYSGDKNKRIGHGDAGGPLVHANKLIGVISWNPQVVGSEKPEGFTRISNYADWIQQHMT